MQENQKLFIQRHIQTLSHRDFSHAEIIEKSFSILGSPRETEKAMDTYNGTKSLIRTLHTMEVIQLEQSVLDAMSDQCEIAEDERFSFAAMLESDQTINDIFALLKTRLSLGLVYSLWLSVVATTIFTITSLKVLPQFKELFNGLNVALPYTTQLAISWQESIISPTVIGIVLCLIIIFLIILVRRVSKNKFSRTLLEKLPFVGAVVRLTQAIHWLSQMRILAGVGLDINACAEKLRPQPGVLIKYLPEMMVEMDAAQKIDNLTTEFEFQTSKLGQQAEEIVTSATRKLLGLVMAFVLSYVIFSIFATYLAIFQIGVSV